MNVLIRNARIFSPGSPWHLKKKDIYLEEGIIREVGTGQGWKAEEVIEGESLIASVPWFDLMAFFAEPGEEQKETLRTGSEAALFSGFFHVAVHGYPKAPVAEQGVVQKIKNFGHPWVELYPVPSLTENYEGRNLPEIYDMQMHGAKGFSDGHLPVTDEGLILRILQYTKKTGAVPLFYPDTPSLSREAMVHEGEVSVSCGLKGIPSMAEEIFIEKLIRIMDYTGGRAHLSCVSSADSIPLIRKAKKKGLLLTASVPVLNLVETHQAISGFDTNYKVIPPLRSERDRQALWKALEEGVLDAVISNHHPQDIESKQTEFDMALPGHCTLPFFVPWFLPSAADHPELLSRVTVFAYSLMQVPVPVIDIGKSAEISIFDSEAEFLLQKENNPSRSVNSSSFDIRLKGKCVAVIKKNRIKKL